ncbi:MAG: hypothetical protein ABIQ90_04130 [Polaromonas sp.]
MTIPNRPPPSGTAVSRLKDRLLRPWSSPNEETVATPTENLPIVAPSRALGFPASVAEFLLVFRLRIRRRSVLCGEMLERALRVVLVTCKNWFSASDAKSHRPGQHD